MTKLDEFHSIKEREHAFERIELHSFSELLDALKSDHTDNNVFFRGQASARWQVFSSIQREWIQKDLNRFHNSIDDFVKDFLKFCRNKLSVKILTECKEPYDVSILSMLQHYGAPTPFVDFTSNPDIALYFAVNGNDFIKGDEVDNFFSIYVVEAGGTPAHRDNDLTNFEDILSSAHNGLQAERQSVNNGGDSEISGAINNFDENSLKSLDCLGDFSVVYIKETGEGFLRISNPRIDLQNGLFLYQGKKSIKPLESHFSGMTIEQVEDSYDGLFLPKIKVYDIHKAALDEAKEYLTTKNINKDYLGLTTDEFGKSAFEEYLRELAK